MRRSLPARRASDKLELARGRRRDRDDRLRGDVDLKTAIREVTGGGADFVVDPVGGDKAEPALRSLRFGRSLPRVGFAAGQIPRLPLNQVLLNSRSR